MRVGREIAHTFCRRAIAFFALVPGPWLARAAAQTHVVRKPETVVRALGVYEWTGEEARPTASRFVPVTLFIDGQLQDAAVYLARPVPLALQTGTVFELERAGVPQGTLELAFARHEVATGDAAIDDGWLGYGAFKPLAATPRVAVSSLRSSKPSQVEVSGGRPHPAFGDSAGKPASTASTSSTTDNSVDPDRPTLNRHTGNPAEAPAPADGTASAKPTPAATSGDSAGTASDADRPTMKRRTDADPGTAQGTPQQSPGADKTTTASGQGGSAADPDRPTMKRPEGATTAAGDDRASDDDPDRPTLRRRTDAQRKEARKQHDSSSVSGGSLSLNDDPDRPSLHRGKAPGALDDDDLTPLRGLPADVHRAVGVSDAVNRPEHDFARPWEDEAEHATVLARMQELARPLLTAYVSTPAALPSAPDAVHPVPRVPSVAARKAAAAKAAAKAKAAAAAAGPTLADEQLRGYTLSYGGAATYVYSASSPAPDGTLRYVSVVAQREPSGELRAAMQNVTDAVHLDRVPRFELVDAVDAEASNRASLLFELRAQTTRQFALYRVIGAQAQQIFLSGSSN